MSSPPLAARIQPSLRDHYLVEREIGRGGMATVFLALDQRLDRRVAIKVLDPELGVALGPERFRREIEFVARLEHPHVLRILDSGEADGLLYYVMPYVEGESLAARLERERQLSVEEAVSITRQVASALSHAHEHGIVHRDIKPDNILLQGDQALVADFGIARAISVIGDDRLTQTGVTIGTPAYMSPEQATAERRLDGRSDEYSLACVLYEMLAGIPPFTGPTAAAIIARHTVAEVPPISDVRPAVPEAVEDVVMRALAKVPADRFTNITEFSSALEESLHGNTTAAFRARGGDRRSRPRKGSRDRRRSAAYAAVALPLVAALGWLGWSMRDTPVAASRIGTDSDPNRVAVLYFEDGSPEGDMGFIADGLTESLISELAQVDVLSVVSRNGVQQYRGTSVSPDSIGRALRVGTLVSGVVQRDGDRLRVRVSLVDALDGKEIGSGAVDRERTDIFALQDEVAEAVSRILRRAIGREVAGMVNRAGTNNAAAWESMQRAMQAVSAAAPLAAASGSQGEAAYEGADRALAEVEPLDPRWSAPIVERGWLAYRQARNAVSTDPSRIGAWLTVGDGHAARAVALAPNDPDALELRATLHYFRWLHNLAPDPAAAPRLFASAESDFRAAVQANPMQASALNTLSHLLLAKSRTGEAMTTAQRAYSADPYLVDADRTVWRLFTASLDLGNRTEADRWCTIGSQRFPENFRSTECRLWTYSLKGQVPRADSIWAAHDRFLAESPPQLQDFNRRKAGMIAALGLVRAQLPDSARAVAARSRGDADVDPGSELVYLEAIVMAQLDDRGEAIRLLTRYLAVNPQQGASAGEDESWWLENIRDEPAYRALLGGSG